MEFDFIRDRDGQCSLELNGEQTALERWFNAKERQSICALDDLLEVIADIKQGNKREYISSDPEFQITLTTDECAIIANWLLFDESLEHEVREGGYDRASLEEQDLQADEGDAKAECGLDDFAYLLEEWREFLRENKR